MIVAQAFKTFRVVAIAAALPALAMAAAPAPQDIVAARVAAMKKMGGAMKAVGEQVKGGTPDKAVTLAAAQSLAAAARGQGKLFPAGTGPGSGVKTDALANIWTDRATFDASMAKLVAESDRLVAVAGSGDAATIGAQMKAVGATCGGCHHQFRGE